MLIEIIGDIGYDFGEDLRKLAIKHNVAIVSKQSQKSKSFMKPSLYDLPGAYCPYVEYKGSGPENYYSQCRHKENELKDGANCSNALCPLLKDTDSNKIKNLIYNAFAIFDSHGSWEEKFDLIFSDNISKAIADLGVELNYCDPDTSYEEDVTAYICALKEYFKGVGI